VAEPQRIVLHLDMDAFFASCEELRHPELAGTPLVVGGDPASGDGRGVVVAANYAARAFGIRSAMPIREAWRRNPQAHFIRPDHGHYFALSKRIFGDLRAGFAIEQASIDEAFIDATDLTQWDHAADFAQTLRERVARASGGLPCSIGIGPNKLVAKIATDSQKPVGTTIVRPDEVRAFLDPLPAKRIVGIGPKTAERLGAIGIETIQQLRAFDAAELRSAFGSHGVYMQSAARGIDDSRVHAEGRLHKSMSEEQTFLEDTRDRRTLLGSLRRMVSSLEGDLSRRSYWFKSVAVKVRYADFSTHTKQAGFVRPMRDTDPARQVVPGLLDEFLRDPRPIRLVGVRFGDLCPDRGQRLLHEVAA
jgi:DNA polymerase IV (DinB-like DNA polymerase)